MMRLRPSRHPGTRRPGRTLAMFVLLLPVLLGMVGLTIDSGLMLVAYRQAQNAADTAALVAATDLIRGRSATYTTSGNNFAQNYNLTGATITINNPPASGPHAGNSQYAEALVSYPFQTSFIQVLGVNASQTVTARAVAGYENVTAGEGAVTLEQTPQGGNGLSVTGGATLSVNGGIIVNSTGKGYDENGNPVNLGNPQGPALQVSNGSAIYAQNVNVAGGVGNGNQSSIQSYPAGSNGPSPLNAGTGVNAPDPLANLPVPTTSNGVTNTFYSYNSSTNTWSTASSAQNITISMPSAGTTVTIPAGIYGAITINGSGGGTVNFQSGGIFVLTGGKTNALDITASSGTINGNGVMFYNTASNYDPVAGTDTGSGSSRFGGINISSPGVNFSGINNASSPFNGIVIFQDRMNTQGISIQGGSSGAQISDTTYAANALLSISGSGNWNSQFVVGAMSISGQGTLTLNYAGQGLGKAPEVFLVE